MVSDTNAENASFPAQVYKHKQYHKLFEIIIYDYQVQVFHSLVLKNE